MPSWIRNPDYFVYRDHRRIVAVCPYPTTRGQVSITDAGGLLYCVLPEEELVQLFVDVRYFANRLAEVTHVRRVGMASDGRVIHLIPMHGLGEDWKPILHKETVFYPTWPGSSPPLDLNNHSTTPFTATRAIRTSLRASALGHGGPEEGLHYGDGRRVF
ncbi:uncharacterized protein SCHCODRAFT_01172616 [Schizophyllum commune H4-8]|uniref:uncharacterized protein n=1 Tax=Schizophyllum commune (strain H4-8 / FGSC 9210) TaxID=578458 RepID=UPI00215F2E39|nr:uncharacterized protein SCHCODRAFT_01172616 [Schizophyllum commune H4-8]KAI5891755.1 hypothetical protein SCHCODRAFT_01172616 [Schizophyllum commune H4-8]